MHPNTSIYFPKMKLATGIDTSSQFQLSALKFVGEQFFLYFCTKLRAKRGGSAHGVLFFTFGSPCKVMCHACVLKLRSANTLLTDGSFRGDHSEGVFFDFYTNSNGEGNIPSIKSLTRGVA